MVTGEEYPTTIEPQFTYDGQEYNVATEEAMDDSEESIGTDLAVDEMEDEEDAATGGDDILEE